MRTRETETDRSLDTPSTSCTPTMPSSTHSSPPSASTISSSTTITNSKTDTGTADFSCPRCPRAFTSRIGLVGHLGIHRTETDEPVHGAPTYTHGIRLTVLTAPERSPNPWAYKATCAFMKTFGRQLPTKPHHHIYPTNITQHHHPP
nr:unnamed protein product [Spirometra erinaceieuropaei]